MKRFQFNLLALVMITSVLLFTACEDDEKNNDYLSVTPEELEFAGNDSEGQIVEVTSNVNSWRASSSNKWITISEGANDFTVTVAQNTEGERTGAITVKAGEATPAVITVTQTVGGGGGGGKIEFSDIPKSNYVATGTPKVLSTPGSSTWNGQMVPNTEDLYWAITNFGGEDITVFCDFKDGEIVLDCAEKVAENDAYNGYLRVFYRDGVFYIQPASYEYYVAYNKTTRTLNFSGTIAGNPAMIAVVAFNKSTGVAGGFFTDGYENLKLVLTPAASSAPQFTNYTKNDSYHQTKSLIMNNDEMVIDMSQVNKMVQIK